MVFDHLLVSNLQNICEALLDLKEFGGFVCDAPFALIFENHIEANTFTVLWIQHALGEFANTVDVDKIDVGEVWDQYPVHHLPSLDNQLGD